MLGTMTKATLLATVALSVCIATSASGQTLDNLQVQSVSWIRADANLVAFAFGVVTDAGPTPQSTIVLSVYDAATLATRELGPRLECRSSFATGSELVAFTLEESDPDEEDPDQIPPPIDFNGDGDVTDGVLHVYSVGSGEIQNLELVPARPDCADPVQEFQVSGDFVAFRAVEFLNGTAGVDFNGDGDTNDSVLHIHDAATGVTANLGLAIAEGYHWSGEVLAFAVREFEQGGTDLNGNGSDADSVLHLYDASTRTLENLGRAVLDWRISGRRVAYSEEIDLDGDFLDERVLSVYDLDTQGIQRPPQDVSFFDFAGRLAAFSVNELVQNEDLDGDGVIRHDVAVLHVFDLDTGQVTNLGRVIDPLLGDRVQISEGGFAAFRVLEADQPPAVADLNGDGDATDEVLQVYDAVNVLLSSAWVAEAGFELDHARVAFSRGEIFVGPGGTDLNGDGDIQDRVAHVFDVATNTLRNLERAVDINNPGLRLLANKLAFLVSESSEQENLNFTPPDGDLDTTDFVLHIWDPASLSITNIGLEAVGPPLPVASDSVLAFVVSELLQQDDLNGDQDRDDSEMIHVMDFFPPNAPGDLEGDGVDDAVDNCPDTVNPSQSDRDGDGLGDACDGDDDDDGVGDAADNCPRDANPGQENADGDGAGDACEIDDDNDGVNDDQDNCPLDANADQADLDLDGIGDVCDPDQDGDGVPNADDNCPLDPNLRQDDQDGDGIGNVCDPLNDSDADGVADELDNCPVDANVDQADVDGDGVGDACDVCALGADCAQGPIFPGGGRVEALFEDYEVFLEVGPDGLAQPTEISISQLGRLRPVELSSSLGDAIAVFGFAPDGVVFQVPAELTIVGFDSQVYSSLSFAQEIELGLYHLRDDGLYEPVTGSFCNLGEGLFCEAELDHLSHYAVIVPLDTDEDGVFDDFGGEVDNCPLDPNEDQEDADGDGVGDACDVGEPDGDADGVPDAQDNCPLDPNADQADLDADGLGDACDPDDDGDGVDDGLDNCPALANADQADLDADGLGDACDADDDNDGVDDGQDNCPVDANSLQSDLDGDGAGDVCDPCHTDASDQCNPGESAAREIPPEGGSVATGNGAVRLDFDPGDLGGPQTISVTPRVGGPVPLANSLGEAIALFDFQPDGLGFANPVALTIVADVTSLQPRQRQNLGIYTPAGGVFSPLSTLCQLGEDPPGVFQAACVAEILHFSEYALVTPLDTDGDGVFDQFGAETDNCPEVANSDQADLDGDMVGDLCDDDVDGDGVPNGNDQCPATAPDTTVDPQSGCALEEICEEIRKHRPWWTWFFDKPRRYGFGRFGHWKGMRDLNVSDETRALCRELALEKLKEKLDRLKQRLEDRKARFEKKKRRHHEVKRHYSRSKSE